MPNDRSDLIARIARVFSTAMVKEAYDSLLAGKGDWKIRATGEAHRTKPYPMGFYPDDPRIYWARGWGMSAWMWPWERSLLRRAALRAMEADNP